MKAYFKYIILVITVITTSCTDVVDVDLQTEIPRLVIEASLDWEKGTSGNNQTIRLSTTTPYFDTVTSNIVTGATVKITNDTDSSEFVFTDQNDGTYTISDFVPIVGQSYTLEVNYEGETYIAHETLMSVVDFADVYQSTEDGFNDEALEVNILFDDPVDEENYYFFKLQEEGDLLPELFDISDEFTNGNQMKVFYEKEEDLGISQEEFEVGDIIHINLYGISETYSNYIQLLIEQYYSAGDPFGATPVVLKGNCTNPSNQDNFALGYFRLTQVVKTSYTFE